MKYEYVLWFGVLAYGLHIIEEAYLTGANGQGTS